MPQILSPQKREGNVDAGEADLDYRFNTFLFIMGKGKGRFFYDLIFFFPPVGRPWTYINLDVFPVAERM